MPSLQLGVGSFVAGYFLVNQRRVKTGKKTHCSAHAHPAAYICGRSRLDPPNRPEGLTCPHMHGSMHELNGRGLRTLWAC